METGVEDIKKLAAEGWSVWPWEPAAEVYDRQNCENQASAVWFYRAQVYMCAGCRKQCCLYRPKGFYAPKGATKLETVTHYSLTPEEMVNKKHTLTVDEAAYCLRVSKSKIYRLKDTGDLIARHGKPIRIKADSVKAYMENFDE